MGCTNSEEEQEPHQQPETIHVGPSSSETTSPDADEQDAGTVKAPTVKTNKATELRAAKLKKEKEEEEKRNVKPKIAVVPPPTIKMTRAQELQNKKREEEEKKRNGTVNNKTTSKPGATLSPQKSPAASTKKPSLTSSTSPAAASSPQNPLNASLTLQNSESMVMFTEGDFKNFTTHKLLGKGSFGSTYECALQSCTAIVCVKIIEVGDLQEGSELRELRQEIELMKRFNHPNIVQYYGCTEDKTKKTMNIFMEYVTGGSLTSYMKKFEKVPLETARKWTKQMLLGVQYLHDSGIVHRDIKGANLLVTNTGVIKLADFGCSKSIDETCSKSRGCKTMVGTPYWMAPEVLKSEPYGTKADVWSVGCTVIEMITGKPAWPEMENMWAAVYKIANSTGLPPHVPKNLPKPVMTFLERCFERRPERRATVAELLALQWMQDV